MPNKAFRPQESSPISLGATPVKGVPILANRQGGKSNEKAGLPSVAL